MTRSLLWSMLATILVCEAARGASTVTVSPDTFPALLDCSANTASVEELCPRYETIEVTYARATGDVLKAGEELRLALGWVYGDQVLVEPRYTRLFGWPSLQVDEPTAPNLVQVSVDATDPVAVDLTGDFPWVRCSFDRDLLARETIRFVIGATERGGPGQLLPAMEGEIDVILQRGETMQGFASVVDPLPRLRIVGTHVDGLRVLAPGTADGEFDLVIQALQGVEGRRSDRILVPSYAGTVTFSSDDPHAILPPSATFTLDDEGVARVPVTLSRGLRTITVTDTDSGISATSNPVLVREAIPPLSKRPASLVRPRRNVYWGVLQQHTAVGGHGMQSPQYAYEYARDVARLDFLALTEHCATPAYRLEISDEISRQYDEPGRFVTLEAYEWASEAQGHRHVLFRDGRGRTNLCDRDLGVNPTVVLAPTLDDLRAALNGVDALVALHHTAWHLATTDSVVADTQLGDPTWTQQGLFEVYSHHGSSECADNAPYVIHDDPLAQWPADKKVFLRDALQQGFRVGVVAGTDNHFGKPGGEVDGAQPYSRAGLTAVFADQLTRDGLWEALKARRTYGTTGARILLEFQLDGHEMGEEYASGSPVDGRIFVAGTDRIDRVEVYRNGHDLVQTFAGDGSTGTFRFTEAAVPAGEVHNYYVRVTQDDGHLAWSSPIWVDGNSGQPVTALAAAVPNPSNPSSTLRYSLATAGRVSLVVYDVAGRKVRTLVDAYTPAGDHAVTWNGRDDAGQSVASGVYLVRMRAANVESTRKIALLE